METDITEFSDFEESKNNRGDLTETVEKENNAEIRLTPPEDEQEATDAMPMPHVTKRKKPISNPYVLYCVLTLSIVLFTVTFMTTELFGVFADKGIGSDKSLYELFFGIDQSHKDGQKTQSSDGNDPPKDNVDHSPQENNDGSDQHLPPVNKTDIYAYDRSAVPPGMLGIVPLDLAKAEQNYIQNSSAKYDPDLSILASYEVSTDIDSVYPSGSPIVLIVHTHGTESYTEEGVMWYSPNEEAARSEDIGKNVVSIGKLLSDMLNEKGISTVHCDIMHDKDAYTGSYDRTAGTIASYLETYPSIQYVIDLHRDSIQYGSGELVKPVVLTKDNDVSAQVMFVVGTGADSVPCPRWQNNLALAQKLRCELNNVCPDLCRPTCLRDSTYSQHLTPYSVLIEVGASGNTKKEAENAIKLTADVLYMVIGVKSTFIIP